MKINLNITQDLSCSSSKFQVTIYILGRTNFIKNIPHQLDELFVQEEKKRNIDIELRMIKWGKFCIKELVRSDHQLLSSVWRTGRHWNKIMRRNIWLLVWVSTEDPDYCRTLEPLWLQWDDNDSSGVISAVSRDQTTWTGRFGHLFQNNNIQSSSGLEGHSSHLCLYCWSRRNNIL